MYLAADSLDDLLFKVYGQVLRRGKHITPSKGGARELTGVILKLSAPRARLSLTESRGNLFSCIGELLWILAGSNKLDFIQYYLGKYDEFSDDGQTIFGAYGPRMFGTSPNNQVARVIETLKMKAESRQAVIQLFDRTDTLEPHKDVPCTCTLQLMVRDGRLQMIASMRSNDAWLGLPHDVFTFTMLQELIARSLDVELGDYKHLVGSLHVYDKDVDKASRYLNEGLQNSKPMSPMPEGDQWSAVGKLISLEQAMRQGESTDVDLRQAMPSYWADVATLLLIYKAGRNPSDKNEIARLMGQVADNVYPMYIKKRYEIEPSKKRGSSQLHQAKEMK